jgi:hypothetical protein
MRRQCSRGSVDSRKIAGWKEKREGVGVGEGEGEEEEGREGEKGEREHKSTRVVCVLDFATATHAAVSRKATL